MGRFDYGVFMWMGGLGTGLFIGAGVENWPIALIGLTTALCCAWRLHLAPPTSDRGNAS